MSFSKINFKTKVKTLSRKRNRYYGKYLFYFMYFHRIEKV